MADVIMGLATCALLIVAWEQWKNQRDLRKVIDRINSILEDRKHG